MRTAPALLAVLALTSATSTTAQLPPAPWLEPAAAPLLEYRFDDSMDFATGLARNWGRLGSRCDASLGGGVWQAPGPAMPMPTPYNHALALDGDTGFAEVANSRDLDLASGFIIDAWVWREQNADEDVVVGKWYGWQDQWLLTFHADWHGRLVFVVNLEDWGSLGVQHWMPDTSYLGRWIRIGATYSPCRASPISPRFAVCGTLRLYLDGRLVDVLPLSAALPPLAQGSQPVRIGDIGPGTGWTRFHGRIDQLRIWGVR